MRRRKHRLIVKDNLPVLRDELGPETVDLVYLDPPFNSKQNYNVIFTERRGTKSTTQKKVFQDTWTWSPEAEDTYRALEEGGGRISDAIRAFRTLLGTSDMMAYLVMMTPRLRELHRVLKSTGSLYLHCDPTASHYLKILLDAIFGPACFRNEIIWKRTSAHNSAKRYGPVHDVILFYGASEKTQWIGGYESYDHAYIKQRFARGEDRQWKDADITGAGTRNGETGKVWRGFDVTAKGRHWAYPPDQLERMDAAGIIYWPKKPGGWPRLKKYLDEAKGIPLQDVWTDIDALNSRARERRESGYPTQKPQVLLERIIKASTRVGDTVLDPFCGCGTTIEAAEKLGRRWIGIDVTMLAAAVIKTRLSKFGPDVFKDIEITGEPLNIFEAEALAAQDKFAFQWWVVGRLGAPPIEEKKGRDRGVDGRIWFHDDVGAAKHLVISVKAGEHVGPAVVRELRGVIERDRATMGILVTLHHKTPEMLREAAVAGMYKSINGLYPKLQIVTLEDIFAERPLNLPGKKINPAEKKGPTSERWPAQQLRLLP